MLMWKYTPAQQMSVICYYAASLKTILPIGVDVTVRGLFVCLSVMFLHCAQTAEDVDTIAFAAHVSPRSC